MLKTKLLAYVDLFRWWYRSREKGLAGGPYNAHTTAYHEAGHVIAYLSLDVKFEYVTIVSKHIQVAGSCGYYEDGHVMGCGWPDGGATKDQPHDALKQQIIIAAAGPLAERRWSRTLFRLWYRRAESDEGIGLASMVHPSDTEDDYRPTAAAQALLKKCRVAAADILASRWGDIELVADALMRHKTLTYDKVVSLLASPERTVRRPLDLPRKWRFNGQS